jgi:hypothetical protein
MEMDVSGTNGESQDSVMQMKQGWIAVLMVRIDESFEDKERILIRRNDR